jgi:hypothetical protein
MDAGADADAGTAPRRAAFLVGVPRSGTTLLLRLLDGHPELLVLPQESHAADWHGAPDPARAFRDRRRIDGAWVPDAERAAALEAHLARALPGPAGLGDALRALAAGYARVLGAPPGLRAWVEKTPKHLARVPSLRRAFGDAARFVCLVRDPRAVAASQFTLWKRGGARHVRTFASRWAAADLLARRCDAAVPGFLAIRYEDLAADPAATMREVAAHLGIAWHPSLLVPTDRGRPWGGNASTRAARSGVSLEAERSARALSSEEERLLERLLAPRMHARGYAPRDAAAGGPSAARAWIEIVARVRLLRDADPVRERAPGVSAGGAGPARREARLPAG